MEMHRHFYTKFIFKIIIKITVLAKHSNNILIYLIKHACSFSGTKNTTFVTVVSVFCFGVFFSFFLIDSCKRFTDIIKYKAWW